MSLNKKKLCLFSLFFLIIVSLPYSDSVFDEDLEPDDVLFEELLIEEITDYEIPDEEILDDLFFESEEETFFTTQDYLEDDYYDDYYDEFDDSILFEGPHLVIEAPVFETRSIDDIFPNLSEGLKALIMSDDGLRHSFSVNEPPIFTPYPDLNIDLYESVMDKDPSHLIEALLVMPYTDRELGLLDIYNALGRVSNIKDYPATVNNNDVYIFTESTRLESSSNRRAIPDPPPSMNLPFSETMYIRLREINMGNLFLRGDITFSVYGLTYSMTNFLDVRYFFFPIVRAERFSAIIYLEPVKEGMLIYCVSGFYLPGFIADRANLTPNINRRIEIFIKWITDGLRLQ